MRIWMMAGALMVAGCATQTPPQSVVTSPAIAVPAAPPVPSTASSSGFATILDAPVPDYRQSAEARPKTFDPDVDWLWRDQGLSKDQARKRMADLMALNPEFERLSARLRAEEADNYIDARIEYLPDWFYALSFKRAPAATLARYTSNPRFKAVQGRYTPADLASLIKPWVERFSAADILGVHGIDPTAGTASFTMSITQGEYRALSERKGWGPVPDAIKLYFARSFVIPAVDPRAAPLLRAFASDSKPTILQPQRGSSGRIVLRDGCLRTPGTNGQEALAYFHHETGIGLDEQGHLALIDRRTGKAKGRIGEDFAWAGPNTLRDNMPGLAALKAACGDLPVAHVGNPESRARFRLRNPGY